MLGMDPVQNLSIALPPSPGDWMELARETILTGKGMNPVAWVWAYGEVGRFHSQQGNVHLDGKQRILKALRIALKLIFSDLQLPRIRRRLALEMESWRSQATEDRV